jgi:hypothetical protein
MSSPDAKKTMVSVDISWLSSFGARFAGMLQKNMRMRCTLLLQPTMLPVKVTAFFGGVVASVNRGHINM